MNPRMMKPILPLALGLLLLLAAPVLAQDMPDDGTGEKSPTYLDSDVSVEKLTPEQMQNLEERLGEIREEVFRSKASLKQLLDQVRMGSVSLISFSIRHSHEVGPTFELETLAYTLDGFEIYRAVNTEDTALESFQDEPIYEGSLLPGEHLLVVDTVYRGKGYGVFSYLSQYLFKVKSRYSFTVVEGDVVVLNVTSYDEGAFLTSLRDRLKVRFEKE
ncbi:MAG: hypothetical protein H6684_00335 [Deltaproteobacteria bacterium]|nr:hypothetical protein [bacterium]MCB9487156.1 hypothetical protein [Deltaproteobacteria bacterium]